MEKKKMQSNVLIKISFPIRRSIVLENNTKFSFWSGKQFMHNSSVHRSFLHNRPRVIRNRRSDKKSEEEEKEENEEVFNGWVLFYVYYSAWFRKKKKQKKHWFYYESGIWLSHTHGFLQPSQRIKNLKYTERIHRLESIRKE